MNTYKLNNVNYPRKRIIPNSAVEIVMRKTSVLKIKVFLAFF